MEDVQDHFQQISEIRSMMERSTKFLSLSGLSGVFAGVFALTGVAFAYFRIGINPFSAESYFNKAGQSKLILLTRTEMIELLWVGLAVLLASVLTGIFMTFRNARKKGQKIFGASSKRLYFHLTVPLATGASFCLVLIHQGTYALVAPATLIFYGLALFSAGRYTHSEIHLLGLLEIGLGVISSVYPGFGLFFWAIGFGILHIIYGALMYLKYETK